MLKLISTRYRLAFCSIAVLLIGACKTAGGDSGVSAAPKGRGGPQAAATFPGAAAARNLSNFRCSSKLIKVAFFDADSTIRVSVSGAPAANGRNDVQTLPFVARKIADLNAKGYLVAFVSNQGGIPRYTTLNEAAGGLLTAAELIGNVGTQLGVNARVDYVDLAETNDVFRKPGSGMPQMLADMLAQRRRTEYEPRIDVAPYFAPNNPTVDLNLNLTGTPETRFTVHQSCAGAKIDWPRSFMIGDAAFARANARAGTPADPTPRTIPVIPGFGPAANTPYPASRAAADDFSNSDRLLAEQLRLGSDTATPPAPLASLTLQPVRLAFQEPADFFGWQEFNVGNIVSDAAADAEIFGTATRVHAFLDRLEHEIVPQLRRTDPKRAQAILDDVTAVRAVNAAVPRG